MAVCIFGVLIVAHCLVMAGRDIPLSIWTPIAYFWQDLLVALVAAGLDSMIRRAWARWILYGFLVLYVAVNVPITLVLSSPLTWTMTRGAGGALKDSITHYLTLKNLAAFLLVAGIGAFLPLLQSRLKLRPPKAMVIAAFAVVAMGPFAVSRVDTLGLHRNAFGALAPMAFPRADGAANSDWRRPSSTLETAEPLPQFRGVANGRNVVLIILESTAARYLRPYGALEDPMPNLTALASHSILFENAYAVYPESIKGLFSTLCSRYPSFDTPAETVAAFPCSSIAQSLANAGYRTGLFHSGRFMYLGMQSVIEGKGFQILEDAGAIGGNVNSSFGVDEPSTVQRMLSWIDGLPRDEHFFLTYLPIAGHHPYATPSVEVADDSGSAGNSELANYRNALHYGDASLGALFRGLHERDLYENTLFVIFGDHGEAFGQHEGNAGHTFFVYDENVRVPFVIAAPGVMRKQIRIRRPASLIDAAPTIVDLLGLSRPDGFQGVSLLDAEPKMALFFTDYSLGLLGLRDSCWKYIYEIGSGRSKLFDICKDPDETRDVSSAQRARVNTYRVNLEGWIAAQKPR